MNAIEWLGNLHYQICNGGLEQACYNGYIDELLEEWDDSALWIEQLEKEVDGRTTEGKAALEAAIMIDNAIQKLEHIKVCSDCGGEGGYDEEIEDDEGNIESEFITCDRCDGEGSFECNNYSDIDFEYYNTWANKWDSEYYDKIDSDAIDDLTNQSHTHSVVLDMINNRKDESMDIIKAKILLKEHGYTLIKDYLD